MTDSVPYPTGGVPSDPSDLPHPPQRSWRFLTVAAWIVALILQFIAIDQQSLIGDAPIHLLAGEQNLRYGQNRLNLEHPPLVKMLAALPLLLEAPIAPLVGSQRGLEAAQNIFEDPGRLDRVRHRARWVLFAAFGVPFLVCCYLLGRAVCGPRAGSVLALATALSFTVLPFLSVIQTDVAVAVGFLLTLLGGLRYVRRATGVRAAQVGAGWGIAVACKFSGLLLLPVLLLAATVAKKRTLRQRLTDLIVMLLSAASIVYATYAVANRSYDAAFGREAIRGYCRGEVMIVEGKMRPYEQPLLTLESIDPIAAQWLTGLLGIRSQNEIGMYASYAFGSIDSRGRWWFFPAVLLVKTPIVLLAATALALLAWWRSESSRAKSTDGWRAGVVLLPATVLVYLCVALSSSYNLGVRHLFPILPILCLPAACWVAGTQIRVNVFLVILVLEAIAVSPLWMCSTNTWWLGSYNPSRLSLSGSHEYEQNFILLREATRARGIEHLNVLYPPLGERQIQAYVPGGKMVRSDQPIDSGWYAVNVRVEQYIPAILRGSEEEIYSYPGVRKLADRWGPQWRSVSAGEDHGYVAGTFHLYRVDAGSQIQPPARSAAEDSP